MTRARDIADFGSVSARLDTVGGSEGALSNRNLIINGDFQIFQRASSATTVTDDNYVTADRVHFWEGTDGAYTSEQSTDAPDEFGYSMKLAVTTADTSIAAGQYAQFEMQKIEGQNLQSLAYGTNAAKDITLSFWVKSNKTGTYTVTFRKTDTTRYQNVQEYTINSANTWEKKIITVSPDSNIKASGGAIGNDTGEGFTLFFNLALGSTYNGATADTWSTNANHYGTTNQVNWMDSTSNNFYLTGVQLEVGDTATDFEHRSFGDELARCQRYYEKADIEGSDTYRISINKGSTANSYYWGLDFRTTKRAKPTCTLTQSFDDNLTLSVHSAATGRNHMGIKNATGGSTDTRALAEFTAWTADAEL